MFKDTINPFAEVEKERLYNLATGKAATMETESILLNFFQIGDKERKQFVDECINKPGRF